MSEAISLLVGTMTGTAEMVAEEVQEALQARGIEAEIRLMDELDETALADGGLFLICTSTYGQGDVPDNAQSFYKAICDAKPDLSAVRFGLIGLGDSSYQQTFCHGGKRFEEVLRGCGARLIGEAFYHDASSGSLPEEDALTWIEDWADLLEADREAA